MKTTTSRRPWVLAVAALLSLLAGPSWARMITANTVECTGEAGFASFEDYRFVKIQNADCDDPKRSGKKLKQVLIKSNSGLTRYEVFNVTSKEARNIQIRLAGGNPNQRPTKIVRKTPKNNNQSSGGKTKVRNQSGKTNVVARGPSIEIIDPPLSQTRSIPSVITSTPDNGRLIVGKVQASAGLLSLSVNGQKQAVDNGGLFQTNVVAKSAKTPVKIVAIDKQGQRETFEFWLLPEHLQGQDNTQQAGTDTDTDANANDPTFGTYYALVIGNTKYNGFPDLQTPQNDAQAVAGILKNKYGFKVRTLHNATRHETLTAISRLRRELTEKDNLIIYYAGHGEYDKVNNRGHWLPVDAETDNTANWISTVEITDSINRMSAKHILVIADSCYSGALTRSTQTELDPGISEDARQKWLATMAKYRSRTVLTSGGVAPVLDGGGGKHSVFAKALIEVLNKNKGFLEGTQLFRQVKERVVAATEGMEVKQTPEYAVLKKMSHQFSDFIFASSK